MARLAEWWGRAADGGWRAWRLFGFGFLVLVGLAVLAVIGMVEISSRPRFCGSCHVMEPYYTSWVGSSHKEVACVECHIPPGIYSEIQKKKEALSMVVSYFTGTYGTNPWTEVDDAACLQCHQRRLLAGKEMYIGVLFDHEPHLTEMRREKKLRCTSCHSQIVQGSHIAVTASTCALCHFKGERLGEGLARCTLCHAVPDQVIEKAGMRFDHRQVKRFDMQCTWCHAQTVKGDGAAPRPRCYVCHNEPNRLAMYEDHPELHRIHVTEHKVECLHCHSEIEHREGAAAEQGQADQSCTSCHGGGHSPQRELYSGVGGRGLPPRPSAMYLAGVHCEGCHFLPGQTAAGPVQAASAVSCMSCHGPRYAGMLDHWKEVVAGRVGQARQELALARPRLAAGNAAVADAEANLHLVERGHGVHNVDYALDILKTNHELLSRALRSAGQSPLPTSWGGVPYASPCLRCHQEAEAQRGPYRGYSFDHRVHVVQQAVDCQRCHRPHDERKAGEVVSLPASGCAPCHHGPAAPETGCPRCHGRVLDAVLDYQGRRFAHRLHVEEQELTCVQCHTRQAHPGLNLKACADCHG